MPKLNGRQVRSPGGPKGTSDVIARSVRSSGAELDCALCGRPTLMRHLTRHHLRPKSRGGSRGQTVLLCRTCHGHIHAVFSNKELECKFDSLEALRSAPQLAGFLGWVRRQKSTRQFRRRARRSR